MFLFRRIERPDGNAQKVYDDAGKLASTECRKKGVKSGSYRED